MVASNGVNKMGNTWCSFKWRRSSALQVMKVTQTAINKDSLETFMPSSHIILTCHVCGLDKTNHPCLMWRAFQDYLCGLPTRCHATRPVFLMYTCESPHVQVKDTTHTLCNTGHTLIKKKKNLKVWSFYTSALKTK